jgi:esterase/lipase
MEVVSYGNSHAYVFNNVTSDKLIINIEGSGSDSVLGTKNEKRWLTVHQGSQLLQVLGGKYTFLIPEKLNRQPGLDYFYDLEDRANYTAGNILNCYIESINGYLDEHSFSSVILIGSSEGGLLLPFIYEKMNTKDMVTAMVVFGYGGLSLYESDKILSVSPIASDSTKAMYREIIEIYEFMEKYKLENGEVEISIEEVFYGFNYRWFDSFMNLRPFDCYKNIDIPILFIHGDNDVNVAVQSTIYIQSNLSEKPFEYRYYKWAHQPTSSSDLIKVREYIAEWIINNNY